MKRMDKLELSLLFALAVMLFWYAAAPHALMGWWTTAFEPLCDGILTDGTGGQEIVLRSRLWELLSRYLF